MPALHVRNVPEPLYEKLRRRAQREGRSINGEAIAILDEVLANPSPTELRTVMSRIRRGRREGLFARFTDGGRQVVLLAQDEARELRHRQIGTEHLLLGLLREPGGLAHRLLGDAGIAFEDVRARVVDVLGEGTEPRDGEMPFTPAAKEALEVALREALALRHDYIGTEHVLLALTRQPEGLASRILQVGGFDHESTREAVLGALGDDHAVDEQEPRFEYRVETLPDPLEESLERLADDEGWELVSVVGAAPDWRAVLKRSV